MREVFENFEIYYEDRKSYLYAFVSGSKDSLKISLEFWTRVVQKCSELNFNKLLIEEKFDNNVSVADMFTVGEHIASLSYKYRVKIAFIDKDATQFEDNEFGELVSHNRGGDGKIFTSVNDAETWLVI